MKIYKYDNRVSSKNIMCPICGKFSLCVQHHIDRRRNTDRIVWICVKCHAWVHANPEEARELGYYNELDAVYRPKKSNPNKWKLKKKIGF